jgi:hypothetical protein
MHMILKEQARWVSGNDVRKQNQFINNCSICLPEASRPSSFRGGLRHRFQNCNTSSTSLASTPSRHGCACTPSN